MNVAIAQDLWYLPDAKHAQTASPYNSTVEWRWDGKNYAFNFDVFDKVVQGVADAGITGPIHTFAIKGFKQERLTYVDDTQGGSLSAARSSSAVRTTGRRGVHSERLRKAPEREGLV